MGKDKGKGKGKGKGKDPKAMKSFKDLLRSRGGDTADEEQEEKGGWTLETAHGEEIVGDSDRGIDSTRVASRASSSL